MKSLRSRLILSHLLPLLIVVPLAAIALIVTLETQVVLTELSDRLTERANFIIEALEDHPEAWTDNQQAAIFISDIGSNLDGQLFLIRSDGSMIASYSSDPPELSQDSPTLEGIGTALEGEQSVVLHYNLLNPSAEVLLPVIDARQQLIGIVGVTQTLAGIFTRIGNVRTLIGITLLIQLVLGVIIGIYLARKLDRPISTAAAGVIDISIGKDIEPVPIEGPREIRQLSTAVNVLAERLRSLEETRQRSLANIVHELGRPLGAIQSAVHVLIKGIDDPVVERELLEGVDGEIKRMQPLLDDLALLHGQVTGTLTLDLVPVNLSDWLTTALLPWRAMTLEKGLQWSAEIPENLPIVNIDPERMGQVLGNLLSNAVKYTPENGSVKITAGVNGKEAWYRISDTGPGIELAEQGQVFEPFFRSHKTSRFPQGLGLGLTIARDIVDAHGGRLDLSSEPNRGSQFTVHLPLNPP
jgi:signal transduction histidine kinase